MDRIRQCLAWACLIAMTWSVAANQPGAELSPQEKKLLELTNAERKKAGLEPLRASPLLFKVARAHAQNMAKQGKLEHVLDGKNPLQRVRDAGYNYSAAGENIARFGSKTPLETLVKMWMESKIHRENILNPDFTEIGLGIAPDDNDRVFYAQEFGKPR